MESGSFSMTSSDRVDHQSFALLFLMVRNGDGGQRQLYMRVSSMEAKCGLDKVSRATASPRGQHGSKGILDLKKKKNYVSDVNELVKRIVNSEIHI